MLSLVRRLAPLALVCAIAGADTPGHAATATGTFTSRIVIQAECQVITTNTLDFGTTGVILAHVDQTATFQVQCTKTTTYNIAVLTRARRAAEPQLRAR
jgi:spore coat protein U-like protein